MMENSLKSESPAQTLADAQLPEYTLAEVATHNRKDDLWIAIHGQVFDVTTYLVDHPGGIEVLLETAGTDATAEFEDAGHSEDAYEILQEYLVGNLKDAKKYAPPKAVRVIPHKFEEKTASGSPAARSAGALATALGTATALLYVANRSKLGAIDMRKALGHVIPSKLNVFRLPGGEFAHGFIMATAVCAVMGSLIAQQAVKFTKIESGFLRYPPRIKARKRPRVDPHLVKGFLDAKEYRRLPLVQKDEVASNVYRFVFALPDQKGVIGLPIGQHVAIRAVINDTTVSRSYTPVSNNIDLGRLELLVRCYPDGLLSGQYLANLEVGDEVEFRGPKGSMKYTRGICKKIGMVAGGTGITPMYQLIRAICEDDRDTTEICLIYANRTYQDILLREELETFARRYPKNFKLWYMLDTAPEGWQFGSGYVTQAVLNEHLPTPSPDTKILLCGPPPMVSACKKTLVAMGFQAPGAMSRMSDQIFCF
ncbi:putative cytochrome b5 reductase [Aspergillus homomorphus CBS 101889]|uniref:Cytochrome b5 reductase n=1 Tax=Aspergillus homomorphus (strain CBS 101889) TaxID=1450537 RepID=A0A395I692_ASPHC|nr:cytochrome b5 reductase [Aspergillus homomorphus CBS 101889]RAL15306.1 cytochrome b5 reductase [Aspergillus homomorphus CBS 101889]